MEVYSHLPIGEAFLEIERLTIKARINEVYRAMGVVETRGGASPEQTAVIMRLNERMAELHAELASKTA